jgi:single-strand DNA-binding protein
MSRCLNRATLIGYLGADPEIRTLPGGGRVAHVALATTRRWNDRDGKPREKTQWHRITVWDSVAAAPTRERPGAVLAPASHSAGIEM